MTTADDVKYFTSLAEHECVDLLKGGEVGRVAWKGQDGINVYPVNYRMRDDAIIFHTAPGSALSSLTEPTDVAFQVDDIDAEAAIGWSVLARGRTRGVEGETPRSWAPGTDVGVAITITWTGGRVVSGTKPEEA